MSRKLLRVYRNLDIEEVQQHLLIYGDLAGNCSQCQAMDIRLDSSHCPQCHTEFKYIAFRNVRSHIPKLLKLSEQRPQVTIVDCDDFKHHWGSRKAEEFLK